jgi:hypothetical protein
MKPRFILNAILILVIFASCTDTIDNFKFKEVDPKIVIHGAINDKDRISVNISRSLSLNEASDFIPLPTAKIKLLLGSDEVATFSHDSGGWFSVKDYLQQAGKIYTIEAENDGFDPASINFMVPESPVISMISWKKLTETQVGNGQITYIEITVALSDNSNTTDYYTMSMGGKIMCTIYFFDGIGYNYLYQDDPDSVISRVTNIEIPLFSSDNFVKITKNFGRYTLFDPRNELMMEELLFISDEYFKNGDNNIHLKIYPSNFMYRAGGFSDTTQTLWVNVSKISETYYDYALNMAKVQLTNDNPLVEPVTPYNPVEGGFGLVYGYNQISDSIKVRITQEDFWGGYYY